MTRRAYHITFHHSQRHGALCEELFRSTRVVALPAPAPEGAREPEPHGQRYSYYQGSVKRATPRYIIIPEIPETPNRAVEEPKDVAPQPVQPELPPEREDFDIEPPWQYPAYIWRNHPDVSKYDDEVFIFINADSYPTHPDAGLPLIAWLRQPGKLSSPTKTPLYSSVVRVDAIGWVVTFGHAPGAMDRMIQLLEKKAGQILMFKNRRHSIAMDTHLPLEWMS